MLIDIQRTILGHKSRTFYFSTDFVISTHYVSKINSWIHKRNNINLLSGEYSPSTGQ